jgi:hypothetical protein
MPTPEPPRETDSVGPSAFHRFFANRETGKVVIGQRPNGPLRLYLAASSARRLTTDEQRARVLSAVATGSLSVWALLELTRGDSPFRRTVGAVVLAGGAVGALRRRTGDDDGAAARMPPT